MRSNLIETSVIYVRVHFPTGHIWLHVRTAGHWTKQLYEYFSALDPIQENPDKELKMRQRKSHARGQIRLIVQIILYIVNCGINKICGGQFLWTA